MIKYAGTPQLGDYVVINGDNNNYVRLVTSVIANINQPTTYHLENGAADWSIEELTRVKSYWNVGELVRYKGRVHQILTIEVKNYKFVYSLEDIGQWIAEDELEYVNDVKYTFNFETVIRVNKYCEVDGLRGVIGRVNRMSNFGVLCYLTHDCEMYTLPWEAIDIVEDKIEPYNAKLICIESNDGAWEVGELAIVRDNEMYFVYKDTGKKLLVAENVDCLDAVNKFFPRITFAEIKETIGDKKGWNGKFYVADTTADGSLKVGNMYVVKEGILNINGYTFPRIFTSFKEIQKRFNHATLIEIKE